MRKISITLSFHRLLVFLGEKEFPLGVPGKQYTKFKGQKTFEM